MLPAFTAAQAALLICGGATALLVASEWRRWRAGVWLFKPLASASFIAFGWAGARSGAADPWLLAALCACALGDVLLIADDERVFQAGVASFGLGHALYAVSFARRGVALWPAALGGLVLALIAWRIYRWLAPRVPPQLKPAIGGYCVVITAMVVVALGCGAKTGDWLIALGALMFFVSDLSVARDKFVAPAFVNRAWGLPLYYAAQLVLASTDHAPVGGLAALASLPSS